MISSYPQGYSIDPIDCSAAELSTTLKKFSFSSCCMKHEQSADPEKFVPNCDLTIDGFNLGCAHSGIRKGVDDKQYLIDSINRLADEKQISSEQSEEYKNQISFLKDILYTIDVLQRNAQPARMKQFPDWKNYQFDRKPINDRLWVLETLETIQEDSLVKAMLKKCFDSFGSERVEGQTTTTLSNPLAFQIRIKVAQIIVASDLLKIAREIQQKCEAADFSAKSWRKSGASRDSLS